MSEFFVREKHRHIGVGRNAATLIFDRFAGEWEIVEYQRNPGSVEFWRKVVAAYSLGPLHRALSQRRGAPSLSQPSAGVSRLLNPPRTRPAARAASPLITVNARPLTLPGRRTQEIGPAVDSPRWMEHDASEGQIEQYSAAIRQ
jgi:hypothetical protein